MLLGPVSAVLLDESLFFVMLCQCSVTVIMYLQQCVAINVFVINNNNNNNIGRNGSYLTWLATS